MINIRIWHTALIQVLPREQLVAQWREISACAGTIKKHGHPNHLLVNFIIEYDFDHFISYAYYVRQEMTRRGYRTMNSVWEKIISLKPDYTILSLDKVFWNKMNQDYYEICYLNLKEKWMCGGISWEDWIKINNSYRMLPNYEEEE